MVCDRDTTPIPLPATITSLQKLSGDTSLFRVRLNTVAGGGAFDFIPGQFIQLSVPGGGEAPISLASPSLDDGTMELCIRQVGHVTAMLHGLPAGAKVGVRGPYGNGFPVAEWRGKNILLLAGGLGIAPLRALLYFLLRQRAEFGEITLMYGAREPAAILFKEE